MDGSPRAKTCWHRFETRAGLGQQLWKLTQNNVSVAVPKHYFFASSLRTPSGPMNSPFTTKADIDARQTDVCFMPMHKQSG